MSASAPASEPAARGAGTARLLELCGGYFASYVATGILVKWYTGGLRVPRLGEIAFLFDNTLGSSLLCVAAVLALGWLRRPGARTRRWLGLRVPPETPFIVVSGVCTAVIIPATTLLYTLPISVMVAMVIMRGGIIVVSRLVDVVMARQGLLRRPVHGEENWAVVFALLALGTHLLLAPLSEWLRRLVPGLGIAALPARSGFEFFGSAFGMGVLVSYLAAYAVRLYWMNFFKLTRGAGPALDNRGYFAIEQIAATVTMALGTLGLVAATRVLGWSDPRLLALSREVARPDWSAVASGVPYALVAFFSVFLFMFPGRSATFAGIVNRITSLLAGTAATLLLTAWFHLPPPSVPDWVSLLFVAVAVTLLGRVEARRSRGAPGAGARAEAPASAPRRPRASTAR